MILTITSTRVTNANNGGFAEGSWQTTLRVLDNGMIANDNGWFLRIASLLVTLFAISIAAVLIGLIASGIEQRIDKLRRRRLVIETDHTLIFRVLAPGPPRSSQSCALPTRTVPSRASSCSPLARTRRSRSIWPRGSPRPSCGDRPAG